MSEQLDPAFEGLSVYSHDWPDGDVRLDVGAGDIPRMGSGWTTVDRYTDADITADMWDLPFEDGTVDCIWSSHALEHVERPLGLKSLFEWYRVLRVGGMMVIMVPNLDFVCRYVLTHGAKTGFLMLFGAQNHPGEYHKNGWDLELLKMDVEGAGFTIQAAYNQYTPDYTQESLIVRAVK
jgi:predicted SAM-dependent methyltransferase